MPGNAVDPRIYLNYMFIVYNYKQRNIAFKNKPF